MYHITVADVTADGVDVGLIRLCMMELTGDGTGLLQRARLQSVRDMTPIERSWRQKRQLVETWMDSALETSHVELHLQLTNGLKYTVMFPVEMSDAAKVGESYTGTHPLFVDPKTFQRVQEVLAGHNRPRYSIRHHL